MADFFGFEIKRKDQEKQERARASFVAPMDEDEGIGNVINAGGHYGQYVDINGDKTKSEKDKKPNFAGVVHYFAVNIVSKI